MPYKRGELKLVWEVGECIYETLIEPGPTYLFLCLRLGHPNGRRLTLYPLLKSATFQQILQENKEFLSTGIRNRNIKYIDHKNKKF